MAKEIERKFLVRGEGWRQESPVECVQGYLSIDPRRTVRVRIADQKAYLTVKGETVGCTRSEFEYPVPPEEAGELLELCIKPLIRKFRHVVPSHGLTWEVDEFTGENEGLVMAEVELESEQQEITLPDWIGEEVTGNPRFYNANLVKDPFRSRLKPENSIFHITTFGDLEAAEAEGMYRTPSLDTEGFIHCSKKSQIIDTANLFFRGRGDLVLLCIDTRKVRTEIRYEEPAHRGHDPDIDDRFPHIYGALNLDALARVVDFPCNRNGFFELPVQLKYE